MTDERDAAFVARDQALLDLDRDRDRAREAEAAAEAVRAQAEGIVASLRQALATLAPPTKK